MANINEYQASSGRYIREDGTMVNIADKIATIGDLDARGEQPHVMTVTPNGANTVSVAVVSVGGWDITAKTIESGAWVYNGWKLRLTRSGYGTVTVNGVAVELTNGVGYYTVGVGADVSIVVS